MQAPNLPPPPKLSGGNPPPGMGAEGADSATGPGSGGPMAAPMSTPQPNSGIEKAARVQIQAASNALQRELPHFPLDSDEFKAIDSALRTLQKAFGKSKDDDQKLFPAEVMNMLSAIGPGAQSPGQKAMAGPPGAGGQQ